ncbi:MAG: acyl-CoA reductase [Crocinitomicaceae bacterium]|nr:acyl-CoA reductase [Crocinitomicaceae bacterium]
MKREELIKGFHQLGKLMVALGENKEWENFSIGVAEKEYTQLQSVINRQISYNGWFTKENVRQSLKALGEQLTEESLSNWAEAYSYGDQPKAVALIMAGNIPLVGFHDFLAVLISGNKVLAKLSSDDKTLLPALATHLIDFVPDLKHRIEFTTGILSGMEAVIATGSDNSLKYFEQYFGKYPHIFRRNRTSVAVLTGDETKEDFDGLGTDIFSYFGLGCRNVSHLLLPKGFELNQFFEGVVQYGDVVHNNKYGNNYDYNKAVYLLNQHALLDNNFVLLRESEELFSPLAMIHYHFYENQEEVSAYLKEHENSIQVVVGANHFPFGEAQCPKLNDYADGVDVMEWLTGL